MSTVTSMAEAASLIGDPARANMLHALMDGRALTATELAYVAGISAPTASEHLGKLATGGLVAMTRQGRYRYYRIASQPVAATLEALMALTSLVSPPRHRPASRADARLQHARTCYDHFAGRLGVGLADALVARGYVALGEEAGQVTDQGAAALDHFGIDLDGLRQGRRCFCKPCLDWSERRSHLGGALGAALALRCFELGWVERLRDTRAVRVTPRGQMAFAAEFGLTLETEPTTARP